MNNNDQVIEDLVDDKDLVLKDLVDTEDWVSDDWLTGFHLLSHICNTRLTTCCRTQKYELPRESNHPNSYINQKLIR